jgi:hypothetical protein
VPVLDTPCYGVTMQSPDLDGLSQVVVARIRAGDLCLLEYATEFVNVHGHFSNHSKRKSAAVTR